MLSRGKVLWCSPVQTTFSVFQIHKTDAILGGCPRRVKALYAYINSFSKRKLRTGIFLFLFILLLFAEQRKQLWHLPAQDTVSLFYPRQLHCAGLSEVQDSKIQASPLVSLTKNVGLLDAWINFFPPLEGARVYLSDNVGLSQSQGKKEPRISLPALINLVPYLLLVQ